VLKQGCNILVTGATGLIGGELVRALMNMPLGRLWALIRPTCDAAPESRLAERMARSGVELEEYVDSPLRAVSGDMSAERLGLDQLSHAEVERDVDIIIHSAAETSFLRAQSCRKTNIAGTRRVLEFTRACRRRPLLVYLSTAYVSGVMANACLEEDDSLHPDNQHHNEYTRSKAVAEQLVRESGLRVLIVRPSVVVSAGLPDPGFARAILGFIPLLSQFDALPINPDSRPDVVTVQFVVESVLGLLQKSRLSFDCYHVSAGRDGGDRCSELGLALQDFYGRSEPLRFFAPSQWTRDFHRQYIATPEQRKIFASLRNYLPFMNMNVRYDHSRLRMELGDRFPSLPQLSSYVADLAELMTREHPIERVLRPVLA
jgi:thioester reductase-like protein